MMLSDFFSRQAMRPSGFFGRIVMSVVFDLGNAFLNRFAYELMDIKPDDRVFEIGCGTGSLVKLMAGKIKTGTIEGIDFSSTMVKIARKKNKKHIASGLVNITSADVDQYTALDSGFTKACTVNTLYFWPKPEETIKKAACLLNPGGLFIIAFEDKEQLEQRNLSKDVFKFYSCNEVKRLLQDCGFEGGVRIESRKKQGLRFHCAVAIK